jgi:hypothetical protein
VIKGANLRLMHNVGAAAIAERIAEVKALGCNALALVTHHYVYLAPGTPELAFPPVEWGQPWLIYPDLGQDPQHAYLNTPSQDTVYLAARMAKQMGLDVWLKPHLDSNYGAWRGWISAPVALRADLEWAYRWRFLARYLAIAGELDCGLVIGTELLQFTRDMSPEFWIGIAHWCRAQGFKGLLTYAANWGEELSLLAPLWADAAIGCVGVDGYWPIDADGWAGIGPQVEAVCRAANKSVVFTEIGYQNAASAGATPWGVDCTSAVRDDPAQLALARTFINSWRGSPWFAGFLWWEAPRLHNTSERDACEQKDVSHVPTPETAQVLFGGNP